MGKNSFTYVTPHEIQDMTATRGKVTGGVRITLKDNGTALFLNHWRSMMMAHHSLTFLTNAAKRLINTHVTTNEHYNPDTGKTAYDGPTILSIILKQCARMFESTSLMRLDPWRMLP